MIVTVRNWWIFKSIIIKASLISICVCADSRHGHVATVDDDVSQLLTPRLVWQLQSVRGPQRLIEARKARHRGGRGVVGRWGPGLEHVIPRVADRLIG